MSSSMTIALPAQLGFIRDDGGLILREETSDFNDWDGGIVGGPRPCWLFPPNANAGEAGHVCAKCGAVLTFLVQIYAPLNEVDEAFHRDLCLFYCQQCSNVACFRFQMSEENEFYDDFDVVPDRAPWSAQWPSPSNPISQDRLALVVEEDEKEPGDVSSSDGEEDDDDEDEDDEDKVERKCEVCQATCTQHCTGCKQVYYCSVEHQTLDWKPRHKKQCAKLADAALTQRDMDKAAANGDMARFNKLTAGKDRDFAKFTKRTRRHPEQVLRYQRSDEHALWISSKHKLDRAPPACEHCHAPREFEFQLLPQFLSFFPQTSGVDFGTICVYTCTKSCGGSKAQRQEFAYLQPEEQV